MAGPDRSRALRARRARLGAHENALRALGYQRIAGTDEAGAGPLAGPLVAAAVILPPRARLPGVFDSKQLSAAQRAVEAERIRRVATVWSVVEIAAAEVDRLGPYGAALLAMERAVGALDPAPDYLLADARHLRAVSVPQEAVVRGDASHLVIAAASILAKVHRDGLMEQLDRRFPGYGFAQHKGYGTAQHLDALIRLGPCPEHRRRYAPVRALCSPAQPLLPGLGP